MIIYDDQPDDDDHRRASRIRFAAANLPVLLGVWLLAVVLLWLSKTCMENRCGGNVMGGQIGGAIQVFVLAMYGLLQFVFGLALPSNPLPNLMGYPKPDTPALKGFAVLSFVVAALLAAWLVWMQ